jgi:hypothetical protein
MKRIGNLPVSPIFPETLAQDWIPPKEILRTHLMTWHRYCSSEISFDSGFVRASTSRHCVHPTERMIGMMRWSRHEWRRARTPSRGCFRAWWPPAVLCEHHCLLTNIYTTRQPTSDGVVRALKSRPTLPASGGHWPTDVGFPSYHGRTCLLAIV